MQLYIFMLLLLSHFSCVQLCDPIDGSSPGSTVPGILQARTLEWVAISFSSAWKWKVKVKSLSRLWLFVTLWTAAHQAPLSMRFSRQEYWSGVPLPSPIYMYIHRHILVLSTLFSVIGYYKIARIVPGYTVGPCLSFCIQSMGLHRLRRSWVTQHSIAHVE